MLKYVRVHGPGSVLKCDRTFRDDETKPPNPANAGAKRPQGAPGMGGEPQKCGFSKTLQVSRN